MPMVTAAVIFVAGVLFFERCDIPPLLMWGLFAAGCGIAAAMPRSAVGLTAICLSLFIFGSVVWHLNRQPQRIPANRDLLFELEVADVPVERSGGRTSVPVAITAFDDEHGRHEAGGMAVMWSDSTLRTAFGDRLTAFARLRPFGSRQNGGVQHLIRRGFAGTLFITAADTVELRRGAARHTLHRTAVERFSRLDLAPATAAAAASMGAGNRSTLTPELREAYAAGGVTHILAISGLHIGIVFIMANALFRLLALFRHGQIIACMAAMVPVWLYAAAVGFPPSVVRAAVMFTALQLSQAFTASYFSPNILAATIFGMTAFSPDILFDAGFQLSCAAVAAIVTIGRPLFGLLERRNLLLRFLWDTFIIGIVAFVATAPLVCHLFGRISAGGLILNPLVIMCAYVIVGVSVLWIAAPLHFAQPAVEAILDFAAGIQNRAVEAIASCRWLTFDITLSGHAVTAIYALFALLILFLPTDDTVKPNRDERLFDPR